MPNTFVLPRIVTALRELSGLNQSQLAEALGVSASAANQVEKPDHGVQETVFVRYAEACGFVDELEALEVGVRLLRKAEAKAAKPPAKAAPSKHKAKPKGASAKAARRPEKPAPRRR